MAMNRREPNTFMEALEAELRKEIRAELLEEMGSSAQQTQSQTASPALDLNVAAHERLELYLNARLNLNTKAASPARPARFAYGARAPKAESQKQTQPLQIDSRAKAASERRKQHVLSVSDIAALEFFRRNGGVLAEDFTESELKSAYRKIALLTHPDRHAQSSELDRKRFASVFTQANEAFHKLAQHLEKLAA